MVSSEVQRTLVKSPPELWAELSDPAALARHLSELGEIRIVETKPEERVEWESDGATGMVLIKASGWGTKVTLSVTKEIEEAVEEEPVVEEPGVDGPQTEPPVGELSEPETGLPAAIVVDDEPEIEIEAETPSVESEIKADASEEVLEEPRRGFFSRLFRRRSRRDAEPIATTEPTPPPAPVETPAPEQSAPSPEVVIETPTETSVDISAELQAAEEAATADVTEILTAVLDRLGAAHHRPFSRA